MIARDKILQAFSSYNLPCKSPDSFSAFQWQTCEKFRCRTSFTRTFYEKAKTPTLKVVLIAKRNDRPLQTYRPNVGKVRKTIDSAYDGMIINCEVQTSSCFAIITIFRNPHISVGTVVLVHEPIFIHWCLLGK